MKDSDFLDLANRVIDGVGSEHDCAALDVVIRDSLHRRLEYEQLSAVASILDTVRPIEPPPHLRSKILSSLPLRAYSAQESRLSKVWSSIVEAVAARPRVSLAYAVVAGCIVGIVGYGMVVGSIGTEDTNVYGTLSSYQAPHDLVVADETKVTSSGLDADLTLATIEGGFRIEIELSTESPVDVEVGLDGAAGKWAGIVRLDGSSDVSAALAGDTIILSGLHSGRYVLLGATPRDAEPAGRVNFAFRLDDGTTAPGSVAFR